MYFYVEYVLYVWLVYLGSPLYNCILYKDQYHDGHFKGE